MSEDVIDTMKVAERERAITSLQGSVANSYNELCIAPPPILLLTVQKRHWLTTTVRSR